VQRLGKGLFRLREESVCTSRSFARRFVLLSAALLLCLGLGLGLAACTGSGGPAAAAQAPLDLHLFLGVGREDGSEDRHELWLEPLDEPVVGEPVWMLRVRHAPAGTWPLLFERVAVQQIPAQDVAALHRALLRARAFEIPSWLEGAPSTGGSPLTLRLQSRGAFRQIGAAGRVEDRLTRTLRSIDRWSPIRLGPWPDWLAGLFDESDPRPEIPVDREHALRMHRAWSQQSPDLGQLHLDLFALLVALERYDLARFEVRQLPANLQGLRAELEKLLR
jgi:hypothetical protein